MAHRDATASSGLPDGPDSGKGLSLDSDIPGTKTFVKPESEKREPSSKDTSIYDVEFPDDRGKVNNRPNIVDRTGPPPGSYGLGGRDPKDSKPWRGGIPRGKNASVEFVAEWYLSSLAPEKHIGLTRGKTAKTIQQVLEELSPVVQERAQHCSVILKSFDSKILRWTFSVDSGNGPRVVRVRAIRSKRSNSISDADVWVACSCPAWRWQGPEHHAVQNGYQNGRQVGTASNPVIRDPDRVHKVCKHVAAVLSSASKWGAPLSKSRK